MGMPRSWIACLISLVTIPLMINIYIFTNVSGITNSKKLLESNLAFMRMDSIAKEVPGEIDTLSSENRFHPANGVRNHCDVVHVAMISAGYTATFATATVIKSILFFRKNPLHFHLVVDEIANRTLQTLFQSWDLPNVHLTYYRSEELVPKIAWIPNAHYSGVFGLLKLLLPEIVLEDKVIVLDIDVTVSTNIAELWTFFDHFHREQMIGLVENQSDWYLGNDWYNLTPWPALGRGYNTGVMLMHLKRMRERKFNETWQEVSRVPLEEISRVHLADQDIINALIQQYPRVVYKLSCTWNIQFGTHSLSESCYRNTNEINIIHWNSPKREAINIHQSNDFRKAYQIILELDGNLLKRELFACTSAKISSRGNAVDNPCEKFDASAAIKYRTHLFLLEYDNNAQIMPDVTLTTQCSADRLTLLEELCKRWPGAMSIALYFTDAEAHNFINFVHSSSELKNRKNIAYHVVYKEGEFYPVNYLRNVAMSHVTTPYVFQLDVDFLPPENLYQVLVKNIIELQLNDSSKVALIVPAFETERYRFSFPKNKAALVYSLNRGVFYTFRYHIWSQGHAATNYTYWCKTSEPYEVPWEPDFEPYIVVPKTAPIYDTRFVGFGWNKVSHIAHLTAAGYRFIVVPDGFVIHRPHAPSFDIIKFRQDATYRKCLKKLKLKFVNELVTKYENSMPLNFRDYSKAQYTKSQEIKT